MQAIKQKINLDVEKFKELGRKYNHKFYDRSKWEKKTEAIFELVRMMGDQVDSRFTYKYDELMEEFVIEATLWLAETGENKLHETIYFDGNDVYEELERLLKEFNKQFKIECIKLDENPDEW